MRRRCTVPSSEKYPRYGGRGISVCADWQSFDVFYAWATSSGYAEGLSIDRIDNDGNYEPGNCRWATRSTQSGNRRNNVLVTIFGETKNMTEWSRDPRCVVSYMALKLRIERRGWEPARALTTPVIKNNDEATHCPADHEYTPDNIVWEGPDKAWRKCKTCMRNRARARHAERDRDSG